MNKREQKKLLRKENETRAKRKNTITTVLFFAGILLIGFLCIYSHIQYYWTIIDYKIPLAVFMISGTVFGVCFKLYFKKIVIKVHGFLYFLFAGSVTTALFFFLNNLLANAQIYSIKAPILETYYTSMKGGRSKGIGVDVQLVNFTKQLHFSLESENKINGAHAILLSVSKGSLGFEIIKDRIPVE
ncbi:MAG: hypothetical protein ACTHJT_04250 [Cytophaga sp.]|uniref:hypothetical protein n=1 Tax=Cytophaga sp. TaxID=29535 RepID=UPI003F7D5001